jgi:hypothetical protein
MRFAIVISQIKFWQHCCRRWDFVGWFLLTVSVFCCEVSAQNWTEPEDVFSASAGKSFYSPESHLSYSNRQYHCLDDPLCSQSDQPSFVFMPEGFIYPTYLGNPHEPRLGTQWVYEKDDGWLWDSTLGGRLGLLRWGPADRLEGVQLDILAAAKLRMDPNEGQDVRSVDFRVDVPITWGAGPHRFKLGYSHISSHLGDEFLLKNMGFDRLNYFRDSVVLGYSYYPIPSVRLYGESAYAFWREVAGPWRFTMGLDYAPPIPTGSQGAPFFALNGDLREEVDFGGGVAAQAGWAWRSEHYPGLLRTGLSYYNGKSPQFSFFNQHEEQIGWGLWYDF